LPAVVETSLPTDARPTGNRPPDIVILLLDEHGREDLLSAKYNEDISGFVASLQGRGFDFSPRSRSNYMSTGLSLTSMFNYSHLSDLALPVQTDPRYSAAIRGYIVQNKVFAALRSVGYRVATVSAGFDGLAFRSSDVSMDGGQINELEAALITNSILGPTLTTVAPDAFPDQIRDRVRWNLDPRNWLPSLTAPGRSHDPFFLFVHVPSPHQPYVFGRGGDATRNPEIALSDNLPYLNRTPQQVSVLAQAYADQLAYIDDLTISAVDELLLSVPSDCIVIVMSDHGPGVHIDWEHLATTDTRERFGTLFAARTPGSTRLFGDAPTPVNLFPTLLNHYLGLRLPPNSNSSFIGVPPRHELIDVGDPDA
jgi:hypothetical protein